MTAMKKGIPAIGTAAEPTKTRAANKTARNAKSKQPAPKKSRQDSKVSSEEEIFPPEILADLAVKLLRWGGEGAPRGSGSRDTLSSPANDAVFADALKRAELLLLAASGKSNEDVHAYQLFAESDGLLSFGDIAGRFMEAAWTGMTASNTVRDQVEKLVTAADLAVQKERVRHERIVSTVARYPLGVNHLEGRIRNHLRRMIVLTGMHDLFDDPEKVADAMGQFFSKLMVERIPGSLVKSLEAEEESVESYNTFIQYVCGGLTYQRFMGESLHVSLNCERLGCLSFFLESLVNMDPSRYQSAEKDLGFLRRLVGDSEGDVHGITHILNDCLLELRKPEPQAESVKKLADCACASSRTMLELLYLKELVSVMDFSKLFEVLEETQRARNGEDTVSDTTIGRILELLQRISEVCGSGEAPPSAPELRHLLEQLRDSLTEVSKDQSGSFAREVVDELKGVANGLKKSLKTRQTSKKRAQQALADLLSDLQPYSGDRKCRPYELFLFAAQNQIRIDKLIRKRSDLTSYFVPYPTRPKLPSILERHNGVWST